MLRWTGLVAPLLMMGVLPASAATILSVSGTGDTAALLFTDQALSAQFTLGTAQTDVSISAGFLCSGCLSTVYLTTRIGSTFDPATDTVAFVGLPASGPLLSGLNLPANTYYLTLVNRGGLLNWTASTTPVITAISGATAGANFRANTLLNPVIGSTFTQLDRTDRVHFSVTSADANVPEPATATLLIAGLLAVAFRQCGRSSSQVG